MSDLSTVRVGDYISWTTITGDISGAEVTHVTDTKVITDGVEWRIRDGRLIKSTGIICDWARPATKDEICMLRGADARFFIGRSVHGLSDDDAIKVAEFIKCIFRKEWEA